jgi:hypothetical protein
MARTAAKKQDTPGSDARAPGARAPARRSRRFRFDPRFAIGLALVAASIGGVSAIVANADRTTAVYTARAALAVGDRIDGSDLLTTQVRLGSAGDLYLTPGRLPPDGMIVTRTIAAGELVPASAVGTRAGETVTNIVVELSGKPAAAIGPGSVVDVWSSRQTDRGVFGPPAVLVGHAAIVRLVEPVGFMASDGRMSVEILVPKAKVAAVLESVANGDAIAIVPVNTALGE